MKTRKKLVSILCAAALLVFALPAASAVSAEPLSEYAGENIVVRIAHFHGDGEVTKNVLTVDVPRQATKKEEQKLINSAVDSVTKVGRTSASLEYGDINIGAWAPVLVTDTYTRPIGPITLDHAFSSISFQFHTGAKTGDPTTLFLKMDSLDMDGVVTSGTFKYELGADQTEKAQVTIIVVDGEPYIGGTAKLQKGDTIEVNCKVNRGSVRFAGLVVDGEY